MAPERIGIVIGCTLGGLIVGAVSSLIARGIAALQKKEWRPKMIHWVMFGGAWGMWTGLKE